MLIYKLLDWTFPTISSYGIYIIYVLCSSSFLGKVSNFTRWSYLNWLRWYVTRYSKNVFAVFDVRRVEKYWITMADEELPAGWEKRLSRSTGMSIYLIIEEWSKRYFHTITYLFHRHFSVKITVFYCFGFSMRHTAGIFPVVNLCCSC